MLTFQTRHQFEFWFLMKSLVSRLLCNSKFEVQLWNHCRQAEWVVKIRTIKPNCNKCLKLLYNFTPILISKNSLFKKFHKKCIQFQIFSHETILEPKPEPKMNLDHLLLSKVLRLVATSLILINADLFFKQQSF